MFSVRELLAIRSMSNNESFSLSISGHHHTLNGCGFRCRSFLFAQTIYRVVTSLISILGLVKLPRSLLQRWLSHNLRICVSHVQAAVLSSSPLLTYTGFLKQLTHLFSNNSIMHYRISVYSSINALAKYYFASHRLTELDLYKQCLT